MLQIPPVSFGPGLEKPTLYLFRRIIFITRNPRIESTGAGKVLTCTGTNELQKALQQYGTNPSAGLPMSRKTIKANASAKHTDH